MESLVKSYETTGTAKGQVDRLQEESVRLQTITMFMSQSQK